MGAAPAAASGAAAEAPKEEEKKEEPKDESDEDMVRPLWFGKGKDPILTAFYRASVSSIDCALPIVLSCTLLSACLIVLYTRHLAHSNANFFFSFGIGNNFRHAVKRNWPMSTPNRSTAEVVRINLACQTHSHVHSDSHIWRIVHQT